MNVAGWPKCSSAGCIMHPRSACPPRRRKMDFREAKRGGRCARVCLASRWKIDTTGSSGCYPVGAERLAKHAIFVNASLASDESPPENSPARGECSNDKEDGSASLICERDPTCRRYPPPSTFIRRNLIKVAGWIADKWVRGARGWRVCFKRRKKGEKAEDGTCVMALTEDRTDRGIKWRISRLRLWNTDQEKDHTFFLAHSTVNIQLESYIEWNDASWLSKIKSVTDKSSISQTSASSTGQRMVRNRQMVQINIWSEISK